MSRSEVRGPDARELSSSRAYSFAHAGTACIRAADLRWWDQFQGMILFTKKLSASRHGSPRCPSIHH